MPVRPWLLLLLLSAILFNASLLGGEPVGKFGDAEEVIERFSIKKDCCWILLSVKIEGKPYQLYLDTGACLTGYDKPIWSLLGEAIISQKVGSADENGTIPLFRPPDARLGKLTLPRDSPVLGVDLKHFREDSGEDIDGFLGMDFLKTHIFRMDLDRGEIIFLRKVGPDPGHRLTVTLRNNQPYVRINVPGLKEPEEFVLDTGVSRAGGCFGGCLRKKTFEALLKSGRLTLAGDHLLGGVAGRQMRRYGWLDALSFAGNTHKNLAFNEREWSFLGLDILSRYVVTFDFPHQAIYLKKGRQFEQPYRYDRSGLHVRRVKGQTEAASVVDGRAAAKAGILPGDVLLQMDKEQINGMTLFDLRDRLCEEGKKLVITVRRGVRQIDVTLALSSDK